LAAKGKLSKSMTLTQFENGYWYQFELKVFAESIGIPSANKLRKDELEKAIVTFLKFGRIQNPSKRNLSRLGVRDYEKGLSLKLTIRNYTSNKETKNFIIKEAQKITVQSIPYPGPGLKIGRNFLGFFNNEILCFLFAVVVCDGLL